MEKIKKDPALLKEFTADPSAALQKLLGVGLPKETLDAVEKELKALLASDEAEAALKGLGGVLGGILGGKK